MKVRFLGFQIKAEGFPGLGDIISSLDESATDIKKKNFFILVDSVCSNEFYRGVIITVKDQKNFVKLQDDQGKLCIKVETLDEASNLMEFNFFIVDKASGDGVYLYHHGSKVISTFFEMVRKKRRVIVDKAKQSMEQAEPPLKKQEVSKKVKGRIETRLVCRKEKLEELISNFDRVKSVEAKLLIPDVENGIFSPLQSYLSSETVRLTFDKKFKASNLASAIGNCLRGENIKSARVVAADESGVEHVFKLLNNPDYLDEVDFDAITEKIAVSDLAAFYQAAAFTELEASYEKLKKLLT